MDELNQRNEDREPRAPRKLIEALGAARKEAIFVPPAVDETILREARQRLSRIRVERRRRMTTTRWLAMAASFVLLAAGMAQWLFHPFSGRQTLAKEDVNRDGRVDILDAFQLARELKAGARSPANRDLNGDGRVDEADVQWIARRSVRLGKGGPS